jgi:hypothetical protein
MSLQLPLITSPSDARHTPGNLVREHVSESTSYGSIRPQNIAMPMTEPPQPQKNRRRGARSVSTITVTISAIPRLPSERKLA